MKIMKRLFSGLLALSLGVQTAAAGLIAPPVFPSTQLVPAGFCDGKSSLAVTTTGSSPTITGPFTVFDTGKPISIFAGTSVALTGGITTNNSRSVTVASTTGLSPGMNIQGANFPAGTYITGLLGSLTLQVSQPATASGSSLSFTAYKVFNTTISAAGGGSATLASAPASSISGAAWAIWGTDATAAINAAVARASAAGAGVVQLPVGMCVISASINVDGNVSITGHGAGQSILKWISSSDMTSPVIFTANPNAGSCNYANALPWHDNHFTRFEIDALSATQASYNVNGKGISFSCSVRSSVEDVYVHDTPATCVATDAGMPTAVLNNVLVNCGRLVGATGAGGAGIGEGLSGVSAESYQIANNHIINPGHYGIFMETQQSSTAPATCTVTGNVIYEGANSQPKTGAGGSGIGQSGGTGCAIVGNYVYGLVNSIKVWSGISQDGGTTINKSGVQSQIIGNYVSLTGGPGISLSNVGVNASSAARTIVANNSVNGTTAGSCYAITSGTTDTSMANITVTGNQGFNCAAAGLLVSGSSTITDLQISDNQFYDNGVVSGSTDYTKAGIAFGVNVTRLQMVGNRLYDDGATTQKYGLSVNTSIALTGAQLSDNQFSGNTTNPLNMVGTLTGVINDNVGANPPTISGCSATSPVGIGQIGGYTSGASGACTVVVTPFGTSNIIANNGWVGNAFDATTPADIQTQTASSTTSATFSGTTVTGDAIKFQMRSW